MKIVVDTNRIIAALVKEGTTREILFDDHFEFVTPDYTVIEIRNHEEELKKKTKLSHEDFEVLLSVIFEKVTIIPHEEYGKFLDECKDEISDPDDIPFLATCLATNADGIWAHDPHFKEQTRIKVYTNIDMLNFIR